MGSSSEHGSLASGKLGSATTEEYVCADENASSVDEGPTITAELSTFAVRKSQANKLGLIAAKHPAQDATSVSFWSADPSSYSASSNGAPNAAPHAAKAPPSILLDRRPGGGRRRVDRKLLDSRDLIGLEETVQVHYPNMRAKMQEYRQHANIFMELNKTLVVKTKLDGRCLLFSKMELAAISPLFERAFLAPPGEQRSRHAVVTALLKQCRVSILHALVQTLTSGTLTISGWNVFEVLKASQSFCILEISAVCLRYLLGKLSKDNALKVLQEFQDLTDGIPRLQATALAADFNTLLDHATHLAAEHLTSLLHVRRHLDTFRYLNWSFAKRVLKC